MATLNNQMVYQTGPQPIFFTKGHCSGRLSFDLMVSVQNLQHIPDWLGALVWVEKCSKTSGQDWVLAKIGSSKNTHTHTKYMHIYIYTYICIDRIEWIKMNYMNESIVKFAKKCGPSLKSSPTEAPWDQGLEFSHGSGCTSLGRKCARPNNIHQDDHGWMPWITWAFSIGFAPCFPTWDLEMVDACTPARNCTQSCQRCLDQVLTWKHHRCWLHKKFLVATGPGRT